MLIVVFSRNCVSSMMMRFGEIVMIRFDIVVVSVI